MENKKLTDNITIELHSILRDVLRNLWVVVCAAVMGLMIVYVIETSMYTPEYTSKATLVVNSKMGNNTASTNITVSSEMANVFAEVFVQPSMKSRAAKYAGNSSFNASISAGTLADTNILEVSVTSSNPEKSYQLLCAVLAVYPEISDSVFANAVIDIIKMPAMATAPSNHMEEMNKNLIVSGLTLVAFAVIVILSIFRDTVKDEEAFKNKIDAKLIGSIPHERKRMKLSEIIKKKKKALLINESIFVSLKFSENFYKIAAKIEYLNHRYGSKVFAITSVAENEGKSTTASNIAIALAHRGNKVLLLDLDQKKPALYKIFEAQPGENSEFGDLLAGKIRSEDFIFRRYKKTSLFLAINTKAHKGHSKYVEDGTAMRIINALKERVDFVIIDTAPISVDSGVTNLVKYIDKTMMVVRTDTVYTTGLNDAILTLNEVGADFAGCILNDVYPEFSFLGQSGFDEGGYYSRRYGRYGKYNGYGKYGKYGKYDRYSRYGRYAAYERPSTINERSGSKEMLEFVNHDKMKKSPEENHESE